MDVDNLTPSELRALADQKEKESQPCRVARLKHDVFWQPGLYAELPDWVFTEKEKKAFLKQVRESIKLAVAKGSYFVSYMFGGDDEDWYDCVNFGIEGADNEWAEKHLCDFEDYNDHKHSKLLQTSTGVPPSVFDFGE